MKTLYLRLNCPQYTEEQLKAIKDFFLQFFKKVFFSNIAEEREILLSLVKDRPYTTWISLDKFLPLEHNIDVSRVHDVDGNYLHHVIKYDGRKYKDQHVTLYDSDVVHGIGFNLVKTLLESQGCEVETFEFLKIQPEENETIEILDLDDFFNSGLVISVEENNSYCLKRYPYHYNKDILAKRGSISTELYSSFCLGFQTLIKDYHIRGIE